jgi:putative DNA primase/helicase
MSQAEQKQWTAEEIRAEAERLADAERQQYCNDEPGDDAEPDGPDVCRFNTSFVLKCLARNQVGDAELFRGLFLDKYIFDFLSSAWFKFLGHFYEQDKTESAFADVQAVTKEYQEILKWMSQKVNAARARDEPAKSDETTEAALRKRITILQSRARVMDVLTMARTLPGMGAAGGWDAEHLLLTCSNGVIELETGIFRPGRPADKSLTHTKAKWAGINSSCPTFERFMYEIMDGDTEKVNFLQRCLGYSISGLNIERFLLIFYGQNGQNGKGTLLETLFEIMGDFFAEIPAETLLQNGKDVSGATARPDIMMLRGKRLVWASETNKNRVIDGAMMKRLSGGDQVVGRPLYGPIQSFPQTAKLVLMTNAKPKVDGNDPAIWHRLLLVPFELSFIENPELPHERKRDKHLQKKLLGESSGILAWLYRGFKDWQEQGINPPASVRAATNEYRNENSTLKEFLSECCLVMPGVRAKPADLFAAYELFCKDAGLEADNQKTFFNEMRGLFQKERKSTGRWYLGISLKT